MANQYFEVSGFGTVGIADPVNPNTQNYFTTGQVVVLDDTNADVIAAVARSNLRPRQNALTQATAKIMAGGPLPPIVESV